MTEVRTRDEALATVDRALEAWSAGVTGVLTQAQNAAQVARSESQDVVRKYEAEVAALQALLSAANEESRRELEVRMLRTREALDRARQAVSRITQVEARTAQLNRSHMTAGTQQVSTARSQLSSMSRALDGYRAGATGLGGGGSNHRPPSRGGGGSLSGVGFADLDVSAADLTENPILDDDRVQGTFGKGGLSRADYRWAVQTWHDTVGPGVAAGKSRDHFAERDSRSNAQPLRRTADVYDIFLGSDRIRADRRPDGSLDVVNGRHRILIARELGIKTLPGEISE